ncbi:MAG: phospholipase D family protein [Sporomusaceae bacterium]|nr:phospholipase D family protein [Sporomusaceae bacterium]
MERKRSTVFSQSVRKYAVTSVVVFTALAVGFIAGCTNKTPVSSAETKNAAKQTAVMPDGLKGVHTVAAAGSVDVAFSPKGGVTNMIVGELGKAQKSVQVQAYSFTSKEIIDALIAAKKRGVDVRIIIDKSNIDNDDKETAREKKEKELLNSIADSGILMKVDSDFQIAHSKIMIIDGMDVITGSFNFTYSAENSNAENCLILRGNKALAEQYVKNWQWRWDATKAYAKQ